MWILTFARWSEYYLRERGITDNELERLSLGTRELAMVRPMDEWRSGGPATAILLCSLIKWRSS